MAQALGVNRIVGRSIGVAKLVQRTYREVAIDPWATREAAIVVAVVAVAGGIGGLDNGLGGFVIGLSWAFVSWFLFTAFAWFFGTQVFRTPQTNATMGSLLRTLGYAQAPHVLAIFGSILVLGPILGFVGFMWMLVASTFAIRQVLGLSTIRAVITIAISGIAYLIVIGL